MGGGGGYVVEVLLVFVFLIIRRSWLVDAPVVSLARVHTTVPVVCI